ncbi:CHRD domain-containing protein [bacterium]|nr:CHRD domain-containing protein [bacterium]
MMKTESMTAGGIRLAAATLFTCLAGTALGGPVFQCVLDGPTAGTASSAFGYATVILNDDLTQAEYTVTYSGLEGDETAAHFHYGEAGAIGPRLLTLAPGSPKIGVWVLEPEDVTLLLDGLVYINVHSSVYPSGEIRGDLALTTVDDRKGSFGRVKALFR